MCWFVSVRSSLVIETRSTSMLPFIELERPTWTNCSPLLVSLRHKSYWSKYIAFLPYYIQRPCSKLLHKGRWIVNKTFIKYTENSVYYARILYYNSKPNIYVGHLKRTWNTMFSSIPVIKYMENILDKAVFTKIEHDITILKQIRMSTPKTNAQGMD